MQNYLKSIIYGGLDGIITTFAVVAGVAGAALSPTIILILGFANLLADGLSMAIGDYLSTKAVNDRQTQAQADMVALYENRPTSVANRLSTSFQVKSGLSLEDAAQAVAIFDRYPPALIEMTLCQTDGVVVEREVPLYNAVATFVAFVIFGFVPLVATVVARFVPAMETNGLAISSVLTGVTLFALGAFKSRLNGQGLVRAGLEMLAVGGLAAMVAFLIGRWLAALI